MPENKTQPTEIDPMDFIAAVEHPTRQADARTLVAMMKRITGCKPKMWGPTIIGFGRYHYKYESGREGDFFLTGFSPRKQALSIYIVSGFNINPELMEKLGKYKTGKSCLYVKKLDDVDRSALEQLVKESVAYMREKYH